MTDLSAIPTSQLAGELSRRADIKRRKDSALEVSVWLEDMDERDVMVRVRVGSTYHFIPSEFVDVSRLVVEIGELVRVALVAGEALP